MLTVASKMDLTQLLLLSECPPSLKLLRLLTLCWCFTHWLGNRKYVWTRYQIQYCFWWLSFSILFALCIHMFCIYPFILDINLYPFSYMLIRSYVCLFVHFIFPSLRYVTASISLPVGRMVSRGPCHASVVARDQSSPAPFWR